MPLLRRRRPLLRAAAVGGGAYMMGKRRAEAEQGAGWQGEQAPQAAPAPPPPPQPAAGGISDAGVARLKELGQLHEHGVLTDDEFAQQKAKLLAG